MVSINRRNFKDAYISLYKMQHCGKIKIKKASDPRDPTRLSSVP